MKILYYTGFFRDALASAEGFDPTLVNGRCEIVTDRTKLAEADAVVFHLPNLRSESCRRKERGRPGSRSRWKRTRIIRTRPTRASCATSMCAWGCGRIARFR